jgi:hypothetical protein
MEPKQGSDYFKEEEGKRLLETQIVIQPRLLQIRRSVSTQLVVPVFKHPAIT